MSKKLKTIAQHNAEVLERLQRTNTTNIACPRCGCEMIFPNEAILMSNPPKRDIQCANVACLYETYVLVD
jgi:hypothetical protein